MPQFNHDLCSLVQHFKCPKHSLVRFLQNNLKENEHYIIAQDTKNKELRQYGGQNKKKCLAHG